MVDSPHPEEQEVKDIIEGKLKLQCDVGLGVPKQKDFRADVDDAQLELEIDFLMPFGEYCVVGETTSLKSDVKKHLRALTEKITFLETIPPARRFTPFTIPAERRSAYQQARKLIGCFIYTNKEREKDIDTSGGRTIALSWRQWERVKHYADTLGRFGRYHFLDSFGIPLKDIAAQSAGDEQTATLIQPGQYLHLERRSLSSEFPNADLFMFPLSPAKLIMISRVLRRENLPSLVDPTSSNPLVRYQRILLPSKLKELRRLITDIGVAFTYPTAILALMSTRTHIDTTRNILVLPDEFGALEIIDGQHRLFAYASDEITDEVRKKSRIFVVGVRFNEPSDERSQAWAAQMFIDINTKQTRVRADHQLIVGYELGKLEPEYLAAGMLFQLNNKGVLQNRLAVDSMSPKGSISITTIITKAKKLFRLKEFREMSLAAQRRRLKLIPSSTGIDETILQPGREADYIEAIAHCANKYLAKVRDAFKEDWNSKESALLSARYMTALFDQLDEHMANGWDWQRIDKWLERVKRRSLSASRIEFRKKMLAFAAPEVPGVKDSVRKISDHLKKCGQWSQSP